MNPHDEILKWFRTQANGRWDHLQRVKTEQCDNPGWWVKINIKDTALENKPFETVAKNVPQELIDQAFGLVKAPFTCAEPSSENWLLCHVKDNEFNGAGDLLKLDEILRIFLDWIRRESGISVQDGSKESDEDAIFDAISEGDLQAVKLIVQTNSSVLNTAIGNYGESPLMHAISAMERKFEIIEFLVEQGANVNFATKEGYTPLHYNIDLNEPPGSGEMPYRVARLLKDHGADTEMRNHYGWTPLLRAALEGTNDEFKALLDIGAKYDVEYPAHSMPVFTRGESLASISMTSPEKIIMLLAAGFKPTLSLIADGEKSLAEAKDPDSDFSKKIKASLIVVQGALGPPGIIDRIKGNIYRFYLKPRIFKTIMISSFAANFVFLAYTILMYLAMPTTIAIEAQGGFNTKLPAITRFLMVTYKYWIIPPIIVLALLSKKVLKRESALKLISYLLVSFGLALILCFIGVLLISRGGGMGEIK